jgi:hypothetical protein
MTSKIPSAARIAGALPLLAFLLALSAAFASRAQTVATDRENYFPGEPISVAFGRGPGNTKDWIGLYPDGVVPGSTPSTVWDYVDGTQSGKLGLKQGTVTFKAGLQLAGVWNAQFLLNDGYGVLATAVFNVIDPAAPAVRPDHRNYSPGQSIVVGFTNGPANAKDWIAVNKAGQTPGPGTSVLWLYVDGTKGGAKGLADGAVTFAGGLPAGEYRAFLLENDGYTVLASEPITVAVPAQTGPLLLSMLPGDGASGVPADALCTATITNGTLASVVKSSVVLTLDGVAVPAVVTATAAQVTVAHTNATLLAPGSTHAYVLAYSDNASPAVKYRATNTFSVVAWTDVVLPAPFVFEDFDAVAEGELPAGWRRESHTDVQNPELDFGNLDSAVYATWTAVDAARFAGRFVTYSNPTTPDAEATDYGQRVNVPNPANVVNGKVLREPLARGRFLFSDSGYRNGSAQVDFLYTPDFDVSGHPNVHVAFKSLWEQNQDSIAALEYSFDLGETWQPVAYFLDGRDIVRTEGGDVDAEATFDAAHADVATYIDDSTGETVGGTYGAFIAAPVSAALAPYIQARVDDDPVGSKRYESFALPGLANRSKVRFRFAHAGTDSWYWGIDDFGLYSVSPSAPPVLVTKRVAGGIEVSWPEGTTGYTIETALKLSDAAWTPLVGVTGNKLLLTPEAAAKFVRLRR